MRFLRPVLARCVVLAAALLLPNVALAQAPVSSPSAPPSSGGEGNWEPLGQLPVDGAGAGRRGYTLPAEDTGVTPPGVNRFWLHAVMSNNLYGEETKNFRVSVRYETQTAALGFSRGFKLGKVPRVDIGGQIQVNRRGTGVLNGFIAGFEDFWVGLTGNEGSKSALREPGAALPPLGTEIAPSGRPVYRDDVGSGFGDVYLVGRLALADGAPSSRAPRAAARMALNIAGPARFSSGNFLGYGLSVDTKLVSRLAAQGDLRITFPLGRTSASGLPLKPVLVGFSIGPELGLTRNASISVRYSGDGTPYEPTGTKAFDTGYGDVSLGFGYRARLGTRAVVTQVYARENLVLPLLVRPNIDPDLSLGVKISIR